MEASWPVPKVREPSPLKAPSTSKTMRPSERRSTSLKSQLKEPDAPKAKLASKMGVVWNSSKFKELEFTPPTAVSSCSQVNIPDPLVVKTYPLTVPSAEGQV